jgi:phosphoenolpyruvate synthase/pyruvate phosphate dikinase
MCQNLIAESVRVPNGFAITAEAYRYVLEHNKAWQPMNIPTGIPLVYELDEDMKPVRHYYPGDAERVRKVMQASAIQVSLENHMEDRL